MCQHSKEKFSGIFIFEYVLVYSPGVYFNKSRLDTPLGKRESAICEEGGNSVT